MGRHFRQYNVFLKQNEHIVGQLIFILFLPEKKKKNFPEITELC